MGGYELMIGADVLRGRFRNGFAKPEPVTANEPVEYRVDLLSRDHMFRKGHRIMIQVHSMWFSIIDRNPQTPRQSPASGPVNVNRSCGAVS